MKNNSTLFGQLLQIISRYDFEKLVKSYEAEKYNKGFKNWEQFTAMSYGQLSGMDNLRSIERGLSIQSNKLYHLGIKPIKRSTLSYANSKRSYEVYENLFYEVLKKTAVANPKHKFRFKNPLYSMDTTTIELCLGLHNWAKFRKTKGGIKLHLKLNHCGYTPDFAVVTEGNVHETNAARNIRYNRGDVVVFDRGFNDYKMFASYCRQRIYFVTRMKSNAKYKVIERIKSRHKNILSEQIIRFTGFYSKRNCPIKLRKIKVKDNKTGKTITLLTNQFEWSAKTIGEIYKDRWQIEIFFKNIKQKLKIKSFLGTSKNAILTQIWIALIIYLLLSYLIFLSKYKWTIYSIVSALSGCLFLKKDICLWLNSPFDDCKIKNNYLNSDQLELKF